MALDIEKLSAPISEESPGGENLEYDPLYMKLDELATGTPDRQIGDSVVEGAPPNWNELKNACLTLLEKTRDLRLAVYLTLAEVNLNGLPGFRDGLSLISVFVGDFWESCQPALDPNDDNDPLERINILASLSPLPGAYQDPMMFIHHLRNLPLCKSRQLGNFSMRDIMASNGEIESSPDSPAPESSLINAAFIDTDKEVLATDLNAVTEAISLIEKMSTDLGEKVGESYTVDFSSLSTELNRIKSSFENHSLQPSSPVEEMDSSEIQNDAGEALGNSPAPIFKQTLPSGDLQTRDDALAVLEKVCQYFERSEPNSPIPFLLKRAIRLANMNFLDLIQDISPDALSNTHFALGVKDDVGGE